MPGTIGREDKRGTAGPAEGSGPSPGRRRSEDPFIKLVRPFVLAPSSKRLDVEERLAIVEDVRSVKEKIDAKMAERGHEQRNVKLGVGGIRKSNFSSKRSRCMAGRRLPEILGRGLLIRWCGFRRPVFCRESNRPISPVPISFSETWSTNSRWCTIYKRMPSQISRRN